MDTIFRRQNIVMFGESTGGSALLKTGKENYIMKHCNLAQSWNTIILQLCFMMRVLLILLVIIA